MLSVNKWEVVMKIPGNSQEKRSRNWWIFMRFTCNNRSPSEKLTPSRLVAVCPFPPNVPVRSLSHPFPPVFLTVAKAKREREREREWLLKGYHHECHSVPF